MRRRGTSALGVGLSLALAAWAGPAHAWAPKRRPAAPASEEGEQAPPPIVEDAAGEPGEPRGQGEGQGDAPVDPAPEADAGSPLDEGEAPEDPSLAADEREPVPTSDPPAPTPGSTHDVPADDFEAESGLAPGGYYGHGVILERAPPDGRNRIIAGSILVPLGTIATVTSAVGTWMTVPEHCAERLGAVGIEATASRCTGLFTFNVIRTTYGVLMLGSGATILVLGMLQREKYRKWRHEHGMRAHVEPTLDVGRGASLGLRVRF